MNDVLARQSSTLTMFSLPVSLLVGRTPSATRYDMGHIVAYIGPLLFCVTSNGCLTEGNFTGCLTPTIVYIRHRTTENNQRYMSHGFQKILFGDIILCRPVGLYLGPIGVFGQSRTTKMWEGAFAPPHPLWLRHRV